MNLGELFAREEAKALARARAEIAAEKAAWDAMTPEEQQAHIRAVEAKYEALESEPEPEPETVCNSCGADLDDEGCRFCDGGEEYPE